MGTTSERGGWLFCGVMLLSNGCSSATDDAQGVETLGSQQAAVMLPGYAASRPTSAANARGPASWAAPTPTRIDVMNVGLSEVVVQQLENNYQVLYAAWEGAWEFAVPPRVGEPGTSLNTARLYLDVLNSAWGSFDVTLYAGDGQASTSDFLSPPNAVALGVFSASAFSGSGLDVTAAVAQLRQNAFIGVRIVPANAPVASQARFQGLTATPPSYGHNAFLSFDYRYFVNTPPTLALIYPPSPIAVPANQPVTLSASASDVEDGDISARIHWSSSLVGDLGDGASLAVALPLGEHEITARVTDSQGASVSTTSIIAMQPPPDPCAAAPGDADRDGVCDAVDRCWGFDDRRDADADGTPDACDGLLTVGYAHTCANVADGPLTCWGWNFYGQASPPAGESFSRITAGQVHTCGLRADGTARCWGDGRQGELAVPAGATFTELSAGWSHTCGLKTDGSITCWGLNDKGQATPPSGNDFVSVKPGRFHTCAIKQDGRVVCWGDSSFARTTPPGGTDFAQLSAHDIHSCALDSAGAASCWGSNGWNMSMPPANRRWTQMVAAQYDTCGIDLDGTLSCFGGGFYGTNTPPAGTGHTQLAFFAKHACARAASGGIECWGDQTGTGGSNAVPVALR